ncbi:MAG: hypothetical protein HOQ22_18435, partial [Nocardioidaceae bacterium]|nr:hypothetical protein [Nocardioidaceae bacterium]
MTAFLRFGAASVLAGSLVLAVPVATTAPAIGDGTTRNVPAAGTTSIRSVGSGPDRLQQPELRPFTRAEEEGGDDEGVVETDRPRPGFQHGIFPRHPLDAPVVPSSAVAGGVDWRASVNGLTHRDTRLANNGNQFSVEPPDQGLCVGGGFVVEAVNSAIQVRSTADAGALTGVQDLNTFLGYPAAIDRQAGVIGPQVIDPVCLYDPDHDRFVFADTTLGSNPDGSFTGKNTIDVAVSNTGDPTGTWTVYHVPAQNDGTDGTPNHGCTTDGTTPGPCFQDYPHIGADANGIFISTNEYDLFGPDFNAAQVFSFSKAELAAHPATIRMTLVENLELVGTPGFTVWPATSPVGQYSTAAGGTEFALSTVAGDGSETGNPTGTAKRIGVWAITNTASLDSPTPDLRVSSRKVTSETYVFPPKSDQKVGDIPLGECINDTTLPTPFGPGCWQAFFEPADEPAHNEVESTPDSLDTRMQQTWFTNGILWGSAGTAVRVGGELKAGVAWFKVRPSVNGNGKVGGSIRDEGYIALANNNLTMPAITMTPGGRGAIGFTVLGEDHFPSAAYVRIGSGGSVGPIHISGPGLGPDDGFTSYKAFVGDPPRTRWGDYGAAVTDGETIWLANEHIGQTCTLAEYFPSPNLANFGSCGGTRTSLGNWFTRITT